MIVNAACVRAGAWLFALLFLVVAEHRRAAASPTGDSYSFGFSGFLNTDAEGWVFQDGEPGEEGGEQGPFVFGTPGEFDLFGNTLVLESSALSAGPGQELWVFSITAKDGGLLFDPADPTGINFFGFRTLGFGAGGIDNTGTPVDPVFSPTHSAPMDVWNFADGAIEVFDADGLIATRGIWNNVNQDGVRLHIGFSSAADSEIRIFDNLFAGGVGDTTELRVSYVANLIPEPGAFLLAFAAASISLPARRHA